MCGIFGIIKNDCDIDIQKNLKTIKHRGPDDEGIYQNKNIVLGFRRLSIIDLSVNGHQPIGNEDSTIWIVCNGEIYNFQEIKKELLSKHKFRSNTDIEVLLHGYEEWGIDGLLKKINGMFAFCLYDSIKQVSYLVRDRIGKKPLYYYQNEKYLAFSSETKSFFKLDDFKFDLDKKALDLFMGFSYLPDNNKTIIKDVYKVAPGYYLKISDGLKIEKVQYWNLPQTENKATFDSAKNEIESLLIDSVSKRLVADVSVGILLSGGLDSSLITAMASKYSRNKIKTISISFENSCIDEGEYARVVAKHCQTDHLELNLSIKDTYDVFKKNIWIYDDLSTVDGGLFSEFLLAQKVRETGVKVVLVGEGADEIFGGYTWFQFSQFPFNLLPNFAKVMGYYYAIMRKMPSIGLLKYSWILYQKLKETPGNFFKKIQQYEIKYSLPNHYCMKVDKGTSAASIEARAPFMDYRVVQLASQLDKRFFLKNNFWQPNKSNEKYILREIAKKYLPTEIFTRKKKGGMLPTYDILNTGLKIDQDLILNNIFLTDFFGKKYLAELIKQEPQNKFLKWQREWVLWKCLVFALWFDYYEKYAKN